MNRKTSTSCTWSKGVSTCWLAPLCCQAACLQQDWQSHSLLRCQIQNTNSIKISQLKYSDPDKRPLPPHSPHIFSQCSGFAKSAFFDEPVNIDSEIRHRSSLDSQPGILHVEKDCKHVSTFQKKKGSTNPAVFGENQQWYPLNEVCTGESEPVQGSLGNKLHNLVTAGMSPGPLDAQSLF